MSLTRAKNRLLGGSVKRRLLVGSAFALAAAIAVFGVIRMSQDPVSRTPAELCRGHGGVRGISYYGLHGRDEVGCHDNQYFVLP